jgi:hypothetical protein
MTRLAICYWGMTRSTKLVFEAHLRHLHQVLKNQGVDFRVFMHTWKTENSANMIWEACSDIPVDYEEYKLLNPDFYKIESQAAFLDTIRFADYFDRALYEKHGGDSEHEWHPQLIRNHLCALESQKRVYHMVKESGGEYDYIMYIRPDVRVSNDFDVAWLNTPFDILIPNYGHYEGYNDRFAIVPFHTAETYSTRIDEIAEFRKTCGRIVSEKYVKYVVEKYYPNVQFIDFVMKIIRPNGWEA